MPSTVLRPYFLSWKNRVFAATNNYHNLKRDLLMLGVGVLTMACIFAAFYMVLRSIHTPLFEALVPTKIIELLFYSFFLLLLVSNTIAHIGNIFTAENMNLLLYTPLSSFRLYLAKSLEALFETGIMYCVFSAPAALAYYMAVPVKPGFVLAGFLVSIPILVIPVGISMVFATAFVAISTYIWHRGQILILVLLSAVGWGFFSLVSQLSGIKYQKAEGAIAQMIGLFGNPSPIWLPSRWAADLVSSYLNDIPGYPGPNLTLLYATASAALALGYLVFDLFLLSVRSRAGIFNKVRKSPMQSKGYADLMRMLIERLYNLLPIDSQTRAIIIKDLSTLVRDRAQSLQLLLFFGIGAAYVVIFRLTSVALDIGSVALQVWEAFLMTVNIMFAGFILTVVMTRLVYPSVSLEGKAFWLLRITPIEVRRLITAKFICWLPVTSTICLSLLLSGVIAINATFLVGLNVLLTGLSLSVGFTGLAIGLGSIFASFEWESPNQLSAGLGTLMLLLLSLLLVTILSLPSAALMFLIIVEPIRARVGPVLTPTLMFLSLYLVMIINILVARWAISKGTASLIEKTQG